MSLEKRFLDILFPVSELEFQLKKPKNNAYKYVMSLRWGLLSGKMIIVTKYLILKHFT